MPEKVIYELDGPAIFTYRLGISRYLFYKKDELAETDLFLVTPISDREVEALDSCHLSLRGAVVGRDGWLVELALTKVVVRYQELSQERVSAYLPPSGLSLDPKKKNAPDTLAQVEAYFAMSFKGRQLRDDTILFSTFRLLVEAADETIRSVLAPERFANSRRATIDYELYPPQLGSLVIAVKAPSFDANKLKRVTRHDPLSSHEILSQMDTNREEFFQGLARVVEASQKLDDDPAWIADNYQMLRQVSPVLPREGSVFESVQFSGVVADGFTSIYVDEVSGRRLAQAIDDADSVPVTEIGTIDIINKPKSTVVISTLSRDRQITCGMSRDLFESLDENPVFRQGSWVQVSGVIFERPRRDYMITKSMEVRRKFEELQ